MIKLNHCYPFLAFQDQEIKYQTRHEAPWEDAEGIGSAGSVLSPPTWRLGRRRTDQLNDWLWVEARQWRWVL